MTAAAVPELPPLLYADWRPTLDTLHLWSQVVGKVQLATTQPHPHWWNVTLRVGVRGLTTQRLLRGGTAFELAFDFIDHQLVLRTDRGSVESFPLADGLSVADFDRQLHELLASKRLDVEVVGKPFGVPMTTPFADDVEHASYDAAAVERFWHALEWVDAVFDEFSGWFCGQTSPVQLFWHSFDLALTRFSGRRAPPLPDADAVTREAYSHEVISFGFWAGDEKVPQAAFYSYTAPEPAGLRERPLRPAAATWQPQGAGSIALLPYDDVRASGDPRGTLLAFLQSAYEAGADAAGWNTAELASSFAPA